MTLIQLIIGYVMINIYCFKWGPKYGPEYVNRLYNSLKKYLNINFEMTCITDDYSNINKQIHIIDYDFFEHTSIFTLEKLQLMNKITDKNNLLLDLDILIHNDITDLCVREIKKPTFIWTHWAPDWHWERLIKNKMACFVNSSFVRWSGTNAKFLWEHYNNNKKTMLLEYDSCDKYIFYEHYLSRKSIDFWEDSKYKFYNYNEQGPNQYKFIESASCCLFNTSHLIKMNRRYFELDNTPNWATELWESYDKI